MPLDAVDTLQALVRIPSVNPMGRDVSGPEYLEKAVTDHLQALFESLGVRWFRQPVEPQRDNIFAVVPGDTPLDSGGRLIVFEAHQDTVPVEGMTIDPFDPILKDGRIQGRGSCDIKGGMAAMLAAFSRLAEERPAGRPTLVMACTVNEEHGYSGATALAAAWKTGEIPLMPRAPDACVVAEPTGLNVVKAHKGTVRWKLSTRGAAAHSSNPGLGENAIYRMGRVLRSLEEYAEKTVPTLGDHPLVGRPTLSVGVISGGISVNTVPDACTIEIDRRVLPGEDPFAARQAVIDHLAGGWNTGELLHAEPFIAARGLPDDNNGGLAEELSAAAQRCKAAGEIVGVSYGTDAAVFAGAGVPSVVFGPGDIAQAHTCDEWLDVGELERAADVYYEFARGR